MILIQTIIAVLIVAAVLLQQQEGGIGSAWGGAGGSYRTKRGAEQFLFWATIVLTILFVVLAILNVLLGGR